MKDSSEKIGLESSLFRDGGEMGALMRSYDWTKSSLGPVKGWPQALKIMIRTLLDCQIPMYVAWGPDLIQFYNDAYTPILGIKHPALGDSTHKTWHEIWPTISPMFADVMKGTPCGFQNMHFTMLRSGYPEDCYFNFSYSPICNPDATVGGVLATCVETTAIVFREKQLQKQREALYSSFMQVPAAVAVLKGPELVYELCNPLYLQLIDKDSSIIGKPLIEAIPEIDIHTYQINLDVYNNGINFIGNEHPVRLTRNGKTEISYFNFNIAPLRNTDDKIEGTVVFAYEVTGQVLLQIKAEKLRSDLEKAVQVREEFTSIASHELRTPLTILSLKLEMIQDMAKSIMSKFESPELMQKTVENAINQVKRLSDIVANLLDVTRIRTDNLEFKFEQMELNELVYEVLEGFREQLEKINCKVKLELLPSLIVKWDRFRMEQVLVNLISNAIKYAPGKPITIQTILINEKVQIIIQDSGPGIPPGEETRIFEPFERTNKEKNVLGLGLGLFIVDKIIKGHHGRIWVENGQNTGARFVIQLPSVVS